MQAAGLQRSQMWSLPILPHFLLSTLLSSPSTRERFPGPSEGGKHPGSKDEQKEPSCPGMML